MARDSLSTERIVTSAIELLDAEGLEGLSMRPLGERLGSAATAVYWHVGSKANLIVLAIDRAWSEIALPDLDTVGWRAAAAQMASELHAMLGRHPWLVQAFGSHVGYGPGKARHDEHSLAIFEAAGFQGEEADRAAATVFMFVLGNALGAAAAASLTRALARRGQDMAEQLRRGMEHARAVAMEFPHLRARLEAPAAAGYAAAPTDTFEFGLKAILDGLDAKLAGAGATGRRNNDDRR